MTDSYTEFSYRSHSSRVFGSIIFALVSPIFIILIFYIFIFFENHFKLKQMGLSEAGNKVITVSSQVIDDKNTGKVIHVSGKVSSPEIVEDKRFSIKFNALKVVRKVEMYQWDETKNSSETVLPGGDSVTTTTYKYKKVWSYELIDSNEFRKKKYRNPKSFRIKRKKLCVSEASIGAFQVSGPHINNLDTKEIRLKKQPKPENGKYAGRIHLTKQGRIFIGTDHKNPKIGDYRVSYEVARPGVYSLIGEQTEREISPFVSDENVRLSVIRQGLYKAGELIKMEKAEVSHFTWVLRFISWIFYTILVALILEPFAVLADVVPWFGDIKRTKNIAIASGVAVVLSIFTVYIGTHHFSQAVDFGGKFGSKIIHGLEAD